MKLLAAPHANNSRRKRVLVGLAILTVGLVLFGPEDSSVTASIIKSDALGSTTDASDPALSRHALDFPQRSASGEILQIFAGHSWYVAPPPAPVVQLIPPKPVAPPLPYSYLGSFVEAGGKPVYYLVRGDRAYDVRVGDTLDGLYKLDAAEKGRLLFTYMPLDERQSLGVGN